MCGRFLRLSDKQKIAKTFEITTGLEETDFESGDDFSPQSMHAVIYQNADGARQIELMHWAFKLPGRGPLRRPFPKFWKDAFLKGRVVVPGHATLKWKEMPKG